MKSKGWTLTSLVVDGTKETHRNRNSARDDRRFASERRNQLRHATSFCMSIPEIKMHGSKVSSLMEKQSNSSGIKDACYRKKRWSKDQCIPRSS